MVSLHNFAHACSNIVNCSRVRLGATSIPMTKAQLKFALALQRQGLISTVQVAGMQPPAPPAQPNTESRTQLANELSVEPWKAYPSPESRQASDRDEISIPTNPAEQRIWIGLKYYANKPVITKIEMISKPSRKVSLKCDDLEYVVRGRNAVKNLANPTSQFVKGFSRPGECIFVITPTGLLEAREAIERKAGGMILCRVW